jgi:hypothetical protein
MTKDVNKVKGERRSRKEKKRGRGAQKRKMGNMCGVETGGT